MATVHRSERFKICVYADDHPPPHFHVVGRGFKATILLASLSLDAGKLPPEIMAEAVTWAAANLGTLRSEWERLNERR
ncbi:DUF4160 domain-containing protein [Methylobacterium sp. A54F]